ncbi:MAG: chemotaxis protein CheC [Lachnospiraceae bacterium]|nr:chemotaxis protein CheC [Lachnospiraceae bacterium]
MSKFESLQEVNEKYFDVLKEIGNIGAGNATTSIANMLGIKIDMKVPAVQLLSFQELETAICPEEEVIVGIFLGVTDDITGSMMFLMRLESARYLVNILMMSPDNTSLEFNEMELSALQEIGNIIAGSYLNALATMTNLKIQPTVPHLSIDMAAAILSVPAIMFGMDGDSALMISTEFGDDVKIDGHFILLPELDSYDKILEALGIPV